MIHHYLRLSLNKLSCLNIKTMEEVPERVHFYKMLKDRRALSDVLLSDEPQNIAVCQYLHLCLSFCLFSVILKWNSKRCLKFAYWQCDEVSGQITHPLKEGSSNYFRQRQLFLI